MMGNGMSLRDFALDQGGQGLGIAADEEESRLHAFRRQRVENPWRGLRGRPIVESEHDFMIVERQAARIGFEPDLYSPRVPISMVRATPSASGGQGLDCAATGSRRKTAGGDDA